MRFIEENILVMWSGGIDSTFTLARILKENRFKEVFAHHIYLKNCERRDVAEALAVDKMYRKLMEIRPFTFTHNKIDDSAMPTLTWDMFRTCSEAGAVSRGFYNHPVPEVRRTLNKFTIGTCLEEGHWDERFKVLEQATYAAQWQPDRSKYIEFELQPCVSKKEEMQYLENLNLLEDTWYCRTPRYTKQGPEKCERCKTCREVEEAKK